MNARVKSGGGPTGNCKGERDRGGEVDGLVRFIAFGGSIGDGERADDLPARAAFSTEGGKPGGEGYVTPAGKIVNPNFRSAPDNPRFTGEI
jgi:hypothetical protein